MAINAELAALAMEQQAIEQDLLLLPNVSSTRLPEIEQRRAALAVGQHTLEQQYKEEKRLTTLIIERVRISPTWHIWSRCRRNSFRSKATRRCCRWTLMCALLRL
ncbi:hypothetical protein A8V19_21205 [Yersinia pestis]|nr:hypothetical protein A8V19_21205 [Yersinia pestis]